ncbi:MAG: transporter associated domain-containing protein [Pseudomonadota bacterium]
MNHEEPPPRLTHSPILAGLAPVHTLLRRLFGPVHHYFSEVLYRRFGIEPRDREQLLGQIRQAKRRFLIDSESLSMIEGVLQVSELRVRDIMIPRPQMDVVSREAALEELLPMVVSSGHSRFPVIGDDRDEVVGLLLAKDLLAYCGREAARSFDIHDLLRPAVFVPESKRLNVLLREFRASRNHMAIVVDEYGTAGGLVTIEDVLEQIVGDIEDEYDFDEGAAILKHSDTEYIAKAQTPIEDFNQMFEACLEISDFDTLGGLVTHALGHLPKRGEVVVLCGFRFEVVRADSRRVHLLNIQRLASRPETGETVPVIPDHVF